VGLFSWLTLNADAFIMALTLAILALTGVVVWLALRLRKAEARYLALVDGTRAWLEHLAPVRDEAAAVRWRAFLDEAERRLRERST
jgi:hypothetical protein